MLPAEARSYRTTIRLDASQVKRHPGGWIFAWGTSTSIGILDYPEFGTQEFRADAEVFDPESMATLRGVPLTIEHPDAAVDEGLVTTATMRELGHGWVQDVAREGGDLRVLVCLSTDKAIAAYETGVRDLSVGYRSRYTAAPGEHDGAPYTGTQSEIRYNHLALLPESPARSAGARFDARPTLRENTMKITIGKLTRTISAKSGDAIAKLAADHKAALAAGTRTDAIETSELVIDETTLVLPSSQVEAIVATVTGAPVEESAIADAEGDEVAPSTEDEVVTDADDDDEVVTDAEGDEEEDKEGARMDAKTQKAIDASVAKALARKLPKLADAVVEKSMKARTDAARIRSRVERLAAPILGDGFDLAGSDVHAIASAAIVRVDSEQKASCEQLAALARKGDQRAAGRLEERFDSAVRRFSDGLNHAGDLGLSLDSSIRSGDAHQDAAPISSREAAKLAARNRTRGIKVA